ncbi:Uncharacterised protein [Klebsiella pneumoniae]|uniref:Uncharacterized protein n=1 Tax=Klebsiella pneumoniae TaxID=573 RepID=A0A377UTP6_KLEPN|nr:Uncharacterised protein [Klebsiella pneumoniae]
MADDHHYAFLREVFFTAAGGAFGLNFFQQGGGAVFTADQIRVFSPPLSG